MVICTQPGRMYPSTTAGEWCSHPVSVSLMPAGSWSVETQLVRRDSDASLTPRDMVLTAILC